MFAGKRFRKSTVTILLGTWMVLAFGFTEKAWAVGIANGDFEGPPPGAGWFAIFGVPALGGVDLPGLGIFGGGADHEGRVGNHPGTAAIGREPSGITQTFDCFQPQIENPHCTIRFDAEHLGGAAGTGEQAKVTLFFGGGSVTGLIPGSRLGTGGRYSLSIPFCSMATSVLFWIESGAGDPPGLTSRLLIDNVECECVEGDQSNIPKAEEFPAWLDGPTKEIPLAESGAGTHRVWDHVWSERPVDWGPGVWTLDKVPVCFTFPGGVTTGGPDHPHHAWDHTDCPVWPNDWHWTASFEWLGRPSELEVWFDNFDKDDELEFEIYCHESLPVASVMVDVNHDIYTLTGPEGETVHQDSWSGYPANLPDGFEPTGVARRNTMGSRLAYPWISRNQSFDSIFIVDNLGREEALVTLTATRGNGDTETVQRSVPAKGFLGERAASLFPGLGEGSGYAVRLESMAPDLHGRWVTRNVNITEEGSPSQGEAAPLPSEPGTSNERVGTALLFGYLPVRDGLISAPVLVNVGTSSAVTELAFYNQSGTLVHTLATTHEPWRPFAMVVGDLVPGNTENLYLIATSSVEMAGSAFVFNASGGTAIGNATRIASDRVRECPDSALQLVDPTAAVVFDFTEPGFYDRALLDPGDGLWVNAEQVLLTPPVDEEQPWIYGEDFALLTCPEDPGIFLAVFNRSGGYVMLEMDEGTVTDVTTVLVGVDLEEDKKKGTTGEYRRFNPHAGEITITDALNPGEERREYYRNQAGSNVQEVTSVADAVQKICDYVDEHGPISKITFANHGSCGQISAGDGNTQVPGRWFGKDEDGDPIGAYTTLVEGLAGENKFADNAQICLVACNVGDDVPGRELAQCLADDLGVRVRAKRGSVYYDGGRAYAVGGDTWTDADPP